MYKKVNITENTLQVLSLFTNGFDREYYIREVEKLLKISPRTAQLILEDLETKGIIKSKMRGKIKLYKLNINWLSKKYLIFVEQYKEIAFMSEKILIKEIIEKIKPNINGIGLIFGSYVKGNYDKESDLDVFVAGTYDKEKIKKISKMYGIEISIKCYPKNIFEKNIHKDILLREIWKNHVIFSNTEEFMQVVTKNR